MPSHEIAPPAPATEDLDAPRLILRDGSSATVRLATPADRDELRRFFRDLSPESRRQRFLAAGQAPEAIVDQFCAPSNPSRGLTLLAVRHIDGQNHIIAAAGYAAVTATIAEVAFAVDDRFHGKGIATLLFERLAAQAMDSGFLGFQATTFADNAAMLDVFRDSGFGIRSKSDAGCIELQLSLTPSATGVRSAEERRRLATVASLRPMLSPRGVAVIGASHDRANIGNRILQALVAAGFTGSLHAVHPRAASIQGVSAVPSARQLPSDVDLAIVAVPASSVLSVVDDCAAASVRSLVVVSAGFAETGSGGCDLQQELVAKVRNYGMRMVGPNCMGLLNLDPTICLNASFSPVVPPAGGVAFSSQSGALGIAILALAAERHVGLSAFVSVGNKADVSSNDLLEYWEADPNTRLILLYLESFGNPHRFTRLAKRVGRVKPIVALKAGRTTAGREAAGSHTAALAASNDAVDALFHQSGVIRADTIDEMFDIAACLDAQPLPKGARVAVLTNGGGPGILAADACEASGLTVVELSADTRARLSQFLSSSASVRNPVDMVASAGGAEYRQAIEALLTAREIDELIVIFTPVDNARTPEAIDGIRHGIAAARAAGAVDKPIVACLMAEERDTLPFIVGAETIPVCTFPENAARALAKIAGYAAWRSRPAGLLWTFDDIHVDEARAICRAALAKRRDGWLTTEEARGVLQAFGIPIVAGTLAHSADEAAALAAVLGFPVVAKLASTDVQHKTDLGVVRTNLASERDVRRAFDDIMSRGRKATSDDRIEGVLIQSMIIGGVETLIGVTHDAAFGPLVGFGLGGIHVELVGDVRFRIAPLTDKDTDELLREPRGARLLEGYRGQPGADVDALREVLLRVSRLAEDVHEIRELDLNPVIALPAGHGCRVVDARIRVSADAQSSRDPDPPTRSAPDTVTVG